ncbi:helix-turn-helix domain-containing protein [Aquihabitans sp. G128]|uniref:MmyB family transcriptional regulator n=1 Tax=Aquihabitans sp. G128 TaxID=2849779 RepID=UPI001C23E1DF|nr:helix-turn-helix domain-containing protein [Aquihabitans sp. G128]QXC59861.1 helix-turn-helix domain-containing protein [Aquihabitans sp. G128]
MAVSTTPAVGELLRDWRRRRRLSQLDLSVEAAVSSRHLSFVETGRSKPSRELVLHLAEELEVPLRERNTLLLAAGYAPAYPEHALDADVMAPAREALDAILAGHAPYPAIIVDGRWNLVSANEPALAILAEGVSPALLAPPINAMRVSLHPDGLAPRIANLAGYGAHLLTRLQRQALLSGDPGLTELHDELASYPGVERATSAAVEPADLLFSPLRLRSEGQELLLFSTLATFGTALDITLSELAIESFFPGDAATRDALRRRFG